MRTSDFDFQKRLGAGAFGCAYRVRSKMDNGIYVIKEQTGRSTIEMVKNEVKNLKKTRHQNIITYYDSWIENNKAYILMEYATHGTLGDLMERHDKPFPEHEALFYFRQIVLGIHHIHKQSILHRDLKPCNIMLHGSRGNIIKIGDFGISKYIKNDIGRTFAGSNLYTAPEILQGKKYDYKCDIWSIGVILYELLSNRYPFDGEDSSEMVRKMIKGEVRSLPRSGISSGIAELTYDMLMRNPSKRPPSSHLVRCSVLFP